MVCILQTQLKLLILITLGFGITKAGMFSQKGRANLTDIIIYVILPCNIFDAFHQGLSPETIRQCIYVMLAAIGLQILYIILNRFLFIKFSPERRLVCQYATIVNNASFMGLPVLESVYGDIGVLYGSIVLVPMRVFMWTAGLSLFTTTKKKEKIKMLATHPCILAVVLGFAYIFAPFKLPEFLSETISLVGNCTTALSMLVVGSILSEVNPRHILDKGSLYYSFFRLVAIPAILFGALSLLGADREMTGVVVLSSAMPAAVTTAMLAEKYGKDYAFATKTIFISTILSMITLPILAEVLSKI